MDSFIDKFAQRRNAQEIIKANVAAEAQENERLSAQVADYEAAVQEIRKASLQNIENAEKVRDTLAEGLKKIQEIQAVQTTDTEAEQKQLEDFRAELTVQIADQLKAQTDAVEKMLQDAEDFIHREDVKVYRNVQAVIQEELPKQTDELKNAMADSVAEIHLPKGLLPVGILTMLLAAAGLAFEILTYFHIF